MLNQNKQPEPNEWINSPEIKTLSIKERREILFRNGFEKLPNMPKTILFRELKKGGIFAEELFGGSEPKENPTGTIYAFPIGSTDIYEVFCKSLPPHAEQLVVGKIATDRILGIGA